MIPQKALFYDLSNDGERIEIIKDEGIIGPVDFGFKHKDKLVIGTGALAGSIIPGTRRLIFTGPSPVWGNFYISTMGGAALIFHKTSLNYLVLEKAAKETSILRINYEDGKILTKLEPVVDVERIWQDYKGKKGTYAMQQYIYDKYGKEFKDCRILSVGPAAKHTIIGAILSIPLENGQFNNVDTWAGRGGLGSLLFQRYNLAGIIYGGDYCCDFDFRDLGKINEFFEKNFKKKMMVEDIEATEKYRYNPAFNTGGTFGVNYARLKESIIFFNWQSVYLEDEARLKVHTEFIVNHYLKQFNEETIVPRKFKHCGEPCPAVCKKMHGEFKKDYEPYEALGPQCGIFDQRAAEKTN
ncbi:MAG: aldehyde ferredoxin oxidoreductase N-terminal domain-containing protein, partial [archaeon]